MKREPRYLYLQFQNVDGQQKTILEILGKNTGVCYYRAIFINGNFQYSDFFVPIRNLTREGIACRLLRKSLKKIAKERGAELWNQKSNGALVRVL